jgi:uncharacterized protein YdcH (DUF465 family)
MASLNSVTQDSLLAGNEEYRRLHEEHRELEGRLKILAEKIALTDAEQIEESKLKKLKLAGRDRMEQIARATHH